MTLPAFASVDDLAARTPGGVAESSRTRAQAALDDASTLIRAEAGKTWVTDGEIDADVPDVLLTVACSAARRVLENPEAATTKALGDATISYANASNDVYLTTAEKRLVRSAAGLHGGLYSIATTREDPVSISDLGLIDDRTGTIYADVDPDGLMFPWLDVNELAP